MSAQQLALDLPTIGDLVRVRPGRIWCGQPIPTDLDHVVTAVYDYRPHGLDDIVVIVQQARRAAYIADPEWGPHLAPSDVVPAPKSLVRGHACRQTRIPAENGPLEPGGASRAAATASKRGLAPRTGPP